MTKNTKIGIGLIVAGIAGYFIWKYRLLLLATIV